MPHSCSSPHFWMTVLRHEQIRPSPFHIWSVLPSVQKWCGGFRKRITWIFIRYTWHVFINISLNINTLFRIKISINIAAQGSCGRENGSQPNGWRRPRDQRSGFWLAEAVPYMVISSCRPFIHKFDAKWKLFSPVRWPADLYDAALADRLTEQLAIWSAWKPRRRWPWMRERTSTRGCVSTRSVEEAAGWRLRQLCRPGLECRDLPGLSTHPSPCRQMPASASGLPTSLSASSRYRSLVRCCVQSASSAVLYTLPRASTSSSYYLRRSEPTKVMFLGQPIFVNWITQNYERILMKFCRLVGVVRGRSKWLDFGVAPVSSVDCWSLRNAKCVQSFVFVHLAELFWIDVWDFWYTSSLVCNQFTTLFL